MFMAHSYIIYALTTNHMSTLRRAIGALPVLMFLMSDVLCAILHNQKKYEYMNLIFFLSQLPSPSQCGPWLILYKADIYM